MPSRPCQPIGSRRPAGSGSLRTTCVKSGTCLRLSSGMRTEEAFVARAPSFAHTPAPGAGGVAGEDVGEERPLVAPGLGDANRVGIRREDDLLRVYHGTGRGEPDAVTAAADLADRRALVEPDPLGGGDPLEAPGEAGRVHEGAARLPPGAEVAGGVHALGHLLARQPLADT